MLEVDSTLVSEQVASSFSIRSDLPLAKGMEASVKTTTPARPLDWLMTQSALIFATSSTLVVMLLKSFGFVLGPGVPTACQPMSGIPAALACATCCAVDLGSKPDRTMPSGFTATAWLTAAWIPAGVPCPSMIRAFQPMALAASLTPSAAPATPGLVMLWAT